MSKLFCAVLVSLLLLSATPAAAHVLRKDTTNQVGAIVHIQPGDDPAAGEAAQLYFDVQTTGLDDASLLINDTPVPVRITGNSITASYTFEEPGVYLLVLTTKSGADTHVFEHTQRVTRSQSAAMQSQPHIWAELAFVGGSVGLIVLTAFFVSRRTAIAKISK